MPDQPDELWKGLNDAYGPATELGRMLADGDDAILSDEDPLDLWGRLCHQGQIYTASFAAVPRLLSIQFSAAKPSWNVLALIAAIQVAYLESGAGQVPADILNEYVMTISKIPEHVARFLVPDLDELQCRAILAVCAAVTDNALLARVLLELTPELAHKFVREWRFND